MADGTKVGNAYVEVTPKAAGNFASVIDSEVSKGAGKGSAFGDAFSGGMRGAISAGAVAVGNILSDMVQSGADAARELVGDAFTGFSDFEQLSGGVEKIFDQADTSKIMADAQAAYADLNMSANEYLESINKVGATFAQTMGDQAGYDTAREGMIAIADFASGTGASLEELNEKYKLITRSTGSYQSIADQFAGILPQTSSDFLEQAQAAGFLSEEYEKLTDVPVAEYQQAVTSMLDKGVEGMGLAGNTLAESTETVAGSLAMADSAWKNWVATLANPEGDMTAATDSLVESLGAVAENALPVVEGAVSTLSAELPGLVATMAPVLVPAVTGMISNVLPAIVTMTPALLGAGMQVLGGLLQAVVATLPQLAAAVVGFAPVMLSSAGQMLIALVDAAVVVLPQVAQTVISSGPMLLAAGMEFFAQLGNALGRVVPMLFDAVVYVITHLPEIVINGGMAMLEAGANLFGGFVEGILGMEPESSRAGTQAGAAASEALAGASDGSVAAAGLVSSFNSTFDFASMEATATEAAQAATNAAVTGADGSAIADQLAQTTSGSIDVAAMDPKAAEMVQNAVSAAKAVDVSSVGAEFSQKAAGGIDTSAMAAKMSQVAGMASGLNATSTVSIKADLSGVSALQGASSAVAAAYKAMGSSVEASMRNAARSATAAAAQVKGSMAIPDKTVHVNVARGSVQLPHFSMSGNFDPKTKAVPTVSVSWWANGAIFKEPTIFANGVGDSRGPEAVMPVEKLPGLLGLDERGTQHVTNIYVDGIQASPESQLYGLLEEVVEAAGVTRRRRS